MANSLKSAQFLLESRIADAMRGRPEALFDLGVCYQTGTAGAGIDLIEAHIWVAGLADAADARADVAEDMTAREIAEAQRQARAWLMMTQRRAA